LRTVRWGLDRIVADEARRPRCEDEWHECIVMLENDMRNTVGSGGYSSSQRAWGRGTNMIVGVEEATCVSASDAASVRVARILELQEVAVEAMTSARSKRALQHILSQTERKRGRVYVPGEAVYYRRPVEPGSAKSIWHGPAVVCQSSTAIENALCSSTSLDQGKRHYFLNHGGVMISAAERDLKGVLENKAGGGGEDEKYFPREPVAESQGSLPFVEEEDCNREVEGPKPVNPKTDRPGALQEEHQGVELAAETRKAREEALEVALGKQDTIRRPGGRPKLGEDELERRRVVSVKEKEDRTASKLKMREERKEAEKEARLEKKRGRMVSQREKQLMKKGVMTRKQKTAFVSAVSFDLTNDDSEDIDGEPLDDDDPTEWIDDSWDDDDETGDERRWCSDDKVALHTFRMALAAIRKPIELQETVKGKDTAIEAETAYAYEWEDVPEHEKKAATEKGISDYDANDAWDGPGTALTGWELEQWEVDNNTVAVKMTAHWVRKAKVVEGVLKGRCRWTPHGYKEEWYSYVESEKNIYASPTTTTVSIRLVHIVGMKRWWKKFALDVSSAFFASDETEKGNLWILEPPELTRSDRQRRWRRLKKEVPGTKGAPRSFYLTLKAFLEERGVVRSKHDPCLFYQANDEGQQNLVMCCHVDDLVGYGEEKAVVELMTALEDRFAVNGVKWSFIEMGTMHEFSGVEYVESVEGLQMTQRHYIEHKLSVETCVDERRSKRREDKITDVERRELRKGIGELRWITRTVSDILYEVSKLSQTLGSEFATIDHINRMKKVKRYVRSQLGRKDREDRHRVWLPRMDGELSVALVCDAAEPKNDEFFRGRWHQCFTVGIIPKSEKLQSKVTFGAVSIRSGLGRRVAGSSFDGECVCLCEGLDVSINVSLVLEEMEYGLTPSLGDVKLLKRAGIQAAFSLEGLVEICCWTDSADTVAASKSLIVPKDIGKRRKSDVMGIQELIEMGWVDQLRFIPGPINPMDAGTKKMTMETETMMAMRQLMGHGVLVAHSEEMD
jgi:hypothetical protein